MCPIYVQDLDFSLTTPYVTQRELKKPGEEDEEDEEEDHRQMTVPMPSLASPSSTVQLQRQGGMKLLLSACRVDVYLFTMYLLLR